jgi:hypothetical protein
MCRLVPVLPIASSSPCQNQPPGVSVRDCSHVDPPVSLGTAYMPKVTIPSCLSTRCQTPHSRRHFLSLIPFPSPSLLRFLGPLVMISQALNTPLSFPIIEICLVDDGRDNYLLVWVALLQPVILPPWPGKTCEPFHSATTLDYTFLARSGLSVGPPPGYPALLVHGVGEVPKYTTPRAGGPPVPETAYRLPNSRVPVVPKHAVRILQLLVLLVTVISFGPLLQPSHRMTLTRRLDSRSYRCLQVILTSAHHVSGNIGSLPSHCATGHRWVTREGPFSFKNPGLSAVNATPLSEILLVATLNQVPAMPVDVVEPLFESIWRYSGINLCPSQDMSCPLADPVLRPPGHPSTLVSFVMLHHSLPDVTLKIPHGMSSQRL